MDRLRALETLIGMKILVTLQGGAQIIQSLSGSSVTYLTGITKELPRYYTVLPVGTSGKKITEALMSLRKDREARTKRWRHAAEYKRKAEVLGLWKSVESWRVFMETISEDSSLRKPVAVQGALLGATAGLAAFHRRELSHS